MLNESIRDYNQAVLKFFESTRLSQQERISFGVIGGIERTETNKGKLAFIHDQDGFISTYTTYK